MERKLAQLAGVDSRRYDSIDALRAIAVLIVVAFHFTGRFPADYLHFDNAIELPRFGRIGVYLFFVISGYCIAMTAERSSTIGLFLLRRFARLQPALVACILVTMVAVSLLGLPGRDVSFADAVRNAFWYPLITRTPFVDGAYWSLMEEAKFYVAFASIYYLAPRQSLPIFGAYTALGATAFFASAWPNHPALVYPYLGIADPYFLFPSSLFFLLGIAAYRSSALIQTVVAAACIGVVFAVWGRTEYALSIALVSVFGLIGVQSRGLRIWRPITFIGLISYPLYLLHQNIGIALIRALYPFVVNSYARIGIAAVVVIGLAALVSWSVEHRFRRWIEDLVAGLARRITGRAKELFSQARKPRPIPTDHPLP